MSIVFTQVKDRDRSTLRQRGPCLTWRVPDIRYGKGKGRGLAGPHVQLGDLWLERKLVAPMADIKKPFMFVDWDETTYDLERGGGGAAGGGGGSLSFADRGVVETRRAKKAN